MDNEQIGSQPPPSIVVSPGQSPTEAAPKKRRRITRLLTVVLGLAILLLIAFVSALGGYGSGISLRQDAEHTQLAQSVQDQFELGLQEMEQGQFFRARQRFEYVIQADPSYPGATDLLAAVLLELNTTATPTLVPTPTVTPTPDLRDVQELYDQSRQYLTNSDWSNAIEALLSLRKNDPNYQAVEVDGMLFLALRNRGIDKILKEADLEGGIYDLTLASRFGPLDTEAQAFLTWTTMYITGASFWGIDWEQVISYFEQVAPQMPSLTDGSGMTATERLRMAHYEYGNTLAQSGKTCKAAKEYQRSLEISYNGQVEAAFNAALKTCQPDEPPAENQPTPGSP